MDNEIYNGVLSFVQKSADKAGKSGYSSVH